MAMLTEWQQPDHGASFVHALENIFVAIRGRGVQWSADDRERAQHWQQVGVSLPRIVSVIEMRAKAWRFVHGDAAGLPIRLRFYEKAVLGAPAMALRVNAVGTAPDDDACTEDSEQTLADRLCCLLDRVPDLVASSDDPALQRAYRQAGMSLGRSLQGKTRDCEAGIDVAGFEGAIGRARKVVRKTILEGIGPSARAELVDPIDKRLATERISSSAAKRRRTALLDKALSREHCARFPTTDGWTQG